MIYILGSIGAGKTSLTKVLSADMEAPAYYEDVEGNGMIANMLQKFYGAGADSRKRTGAMLQISAIEKSRDAGKCDYGLITGIGLCDGVTTA